eukprot:scaffold2598_cov127-Skeletonema_menzelii.AAC.1
MAGRWAGDGLAMGGGGSVINSVGSQRKFAIIYAVSYGTVPSPLSSFLFPLRLSPPLSSLSPLAHLSLIAHCSLLIVTHYKYMHGAQMEKSEL